MTAIRENFAQLAGAMADGDLQKVYQYLSFQAWLYSFENFARAYEENKHLWQPMFRGAYLVNIGVDKNLASGVVVWGTGEQWFLEFIKEKEGWKLLDIRPPAPMDSFAPSPQ